MDKNQSNIITESIAKAILSLGAVLLPMALCAGGMVFFSHFLFFNVFPLTMPMPHREISSWLMALAWESTVIITTVNAKHFGKASSWMPKSMAVCSGIIVLFFITSNTEDMTWYMLLQRIFVGGLVSFVNAVFADLFYKKVLEMMDLLAMPKLLEQLKAQVNELLAKLVDRDARIAELEAGRQQDAMELVQLRAKLEAVGGEMDLSCPYCGDTQDTRGALISHKGKCKHNPKNGIKAVNGHVHV